MNPLDSTPPVRFYFVDEAGDPTLFNRQGKVIVGTEGVSKYFILGCLDVPDSAKDQLELALTTLRSELLADPYFKDVPSFDPKQRKMAFFFHAKDDIPEVRRAVFTLLKSFQDLRFFAAVVGKKGFAQDVQNKNAQSETYRYHPNKLYDHLVKRLFNNKIHKSDEYQICFAKRGSADRTFALKQALIEARSTYGAKYKIPLTSELHITANNPIQSVCLQVADYFLWALQRMYERKEDRYFNYLSSQYRQVIDTNDLRKNKTGAYYSQKKPLTLAALEDRD